MVSLIRLKISSSLVVFFQFCFLTLICFSVSAATTAGTLSNQNFSAPLIPTGSPVPNCDILYIGSSNNTFPQLWEDRGYNVTRSTSLNTLNTNSNVVDRDLIWINLQGGFFDLSATAIINLKNYLDTNKGIYFVGEPPLAGNLPLSYINSWVDPTAGGGGINFNNSQLGNSTSTVNTGVIAGISMTPFVLPTNVNLNGFGWLSGVINNDNIISFRNNLTEPTGIAFEASDMVDNAGRIALMVDTNVFNQVNGNSPPSTANAQLNINLMEFLVNDVADVCRPVSVDMMINKTLDTAAPFTNTQSISYTLEVTNNGPDDATNVQIIDTPNNLTITSVSSVNCTALPCTIANMSNGATETITVMATIDSVGAFDNSVSVSANETDSDLSNNIDNTGNGGTAAYAEPVPVLNKWLLILMIGLLLLVAKKQKRQSTR